MSSYETHIGRVDKSTFAIGDNAKAVGTSSHEDGGDMMEALSVLIGIVSKYAGPDVDEVLGMALAARQEVIAEKPDKKLLQRLTEATRKMMEKLGSSVVEVGALADAVAKISNMVHHL